MWRVLSTACATWAVGLPLALLAVIYGLDAVAWLLSCLPQL
jgi:hypothetical protein